MNDNSSCYGFARPCFWFILVFLSHAPDAPGNLLPWQQQLLLRGSGREPGRHLQGQVRQKVPCHRRACGGTWNHHGSGGDQSQAATGRLRRAKSVHHHSLPAVRQRLLLHCSWSLCPPPDSWFSTTGCWTTLGDYTHSSNSASAHIPTALWSRPVTWSPGRGTPATQTSVLPSNGKTSIVRYRTLSFFAFRLKKKRMFAFFRDFKYKISIEPVRFASIL